jgi:hypothetical protein
VHRLNACESGQREEKDVLQTTNTTTGGPKTPSTNSAEHILLTAQEVLQDAVRDHAHLSSTEQRHVPAAPDTSRFRATKSAMVELRRDHVTYSGMNCMFQTVWPMSAIVGSIHGIEIPMRMRRLMVDAIREDHPDAEMTIMHDGTVCFASPEDGRRILLEWSYGTNFSSVGARIA